MTGFRRLLWFLTFALLISAGVACIKKPTFPNSPVISDAQISFLKEGNEQVLRLDIKYTDGDGNLGLSPGDTTAPFNRLLPNGQVNPNYYNIVVDFYTKDPFTGEYTLFDFQGFNYYGRFPLLADTDYKGPIEGRLRYDLKSINFFGGQRTDLKLRVYVKDRNLNQSNTIDSPSIIINQ